jgi:hypothetical protein
MEPDRETGRMCGTFLGQPSLNRADRRIFPDEVLDEAGSSDPAWSTIASTSAGIVDSSASSAARQRRSPATSS